MAEWEKKVRKVLKEHGYNFKRYGKGSHETWIGDNGVVTVPAFIPSRHTANEILKQAGINYKF